MTAREIDPAVPRRVHIEQWGGHHAPLLYLAGIAAMNLEFWTAPFPGSPTVRILLVVLEAVFLAMVECCRWRHDDGVDCWRCRLQFVLIDGPEEVTRYRRRLRLDHWLTDDRTLRLGGWSKEVPLRLLLLGAILGSPAALSAHHAQMLMLGAGAFSLAIVAYSYIARRHELLEPWCPQCDWEDGDAPADVVPDPGGRKPLPIVPC